MADHRLFAAVYDRVMAWSEAHGLAERRQRLLGRARGRVLEIGAGTGANLAHYPPTAVTSVTALEPDGAMRRRLAKRLSASPVPVELVETSVDGAGFDDDSFDTVVSTLVLCTVPDPVSTARAIRRWLRPDGELLFLEHVRAPGFRGRIQHGLTPVWTRVVCGCHLDRDSVGALRQAGLVVTDLEHFVLPAGGVVLGKGVQGVARLRRAPAGGEAVA
jgi:SAM-dependent methyltransferase